MGRISNVDIAINHLLGRTCKTCLRGGVFVGKCKGKPVKSGPFVNWCWKDKNKSNICEHWIGYADV